MWQERVAQWLASGAIAARVRDRTRLPHTPGWLLGTAPGRRASIAALLPVRVSPAVAATVPINLRGEHGGTLALPSDVTASWLDEITRAL